MSVTAWRCSIGRENSATPVAVVLGALAARQATQPPQAVPVAVTRGGALSAARSPWGVSDGFQPNLPARIELTLSAGGRPHRVRLTVEGGEPREALVLEPADTSAPAAKSARAEKSVGKDGGTRLDLAAVSVTEGAVTAIVNDERRSARWFRQGSQLHLWISDAHHEFLIEDPRTQSFTASASTGGLTTPLPGVVSAVHVQEGQSVAAGAVLMVIEAMKMEHSITAPYDGVVDTIHFSRGDRVPEGSELLALSRTGDNAS